MYKANEEDRDPRAKQAWDEPEAVRLLRHAGELVAEFEAAGALVPHSELYHDRLIMAHDAQDMAAYRIALNRYVEAARVASCEATYWQQAWRRRQISGASSL